MKTFGISKNPYALLFEKPHSGRCSASKHDKKPRNVEGIESKIETRHKDINLNEKNEEASMKLFKKGGSQLVRTQYDSDTIVDTNQVNTPKHQNVTTPNKVVFLGDTGKQDTLVMLGNNGHPTESMMVGQEKSSNHHSATRERVSCCHRKSQGKNIFWKIGTVLKLVAAFMPTILSRERNYTTNTTGNVSDHRTEREITAGSNIRNLQTSLNFGDIQVNTFTSGMQIYPNIATLSDGSTIITWTSSGQTNGSSFGCYAQIYNSDGTKRGSELDLSSGVCYFGGIVAFQDDGFAISTKAGPGLLVAKIYDNSATLQASTQQIAWDNVSDTKVIGLYNGAFAVMVGQGSGHIAQIYDSNGTLQNTQSILSGSCPMLGSFPLGSGNFAVVVYSPTTATTPPYLISFCTCGGSGSSCSCSTIESSFAFKPYFSSICSISGGRFTLGYSTTSFSPFNVKLRIYNTASGGQIGSDIQVSDVCAGFSNQNPTVKALPDGGFIVAWTNIDGSNNVRVLAQKFYANITRNGGIFQVSEPYVSPDTYYGPGVTIAKNGDQIFIWYSQNKVSPTSGYDIFAKRITSSGGIAPSLLQVVSCAAGTCDDPSISVYDANTTGTYPLSTMGTYSLLTEELIPIGALNTCISSNTSQASALQACNNQLAIALQNISSAQQNISNILAWCQNISSSGPQTTQNISIGPCESQSAILTQAAQNISDLRVEAAKNISDLMTQVQKYTQLLNVTQQTFDINYTNITTNYSRFIDSLLKKIDQLEGALTNASVPSKVKGDVNVPSQAVDAILNNPEAVQGIINSINQDLFNSGVLLVSSGILLAYVLSRREIMDPQGNFFSKTTGECTGNLAKYLGEIEIVLSSYWVLRPCQLYLSSTSQNIDSRDLFDKYAQSALFTFFNVVFTHFPYSPIEGVLQSQLSVSTKAIKNILTAIKDIVDVLSISAIMTALPSNNSSSFLEKSLGNSMFYFMAYICADPILRWGKDLLLNKCIASLGTTNLNSYGRYYTLTQTRQQYYCDDNMLRRLLNEDINNAHLHNAQLFKMGRKYVLSSSEPSSRKLRFKAIPFEIYNYKGEGDIEINSKSECGHELVFFIPYHGDNMKDIYLYNSLHKQKFPWSLHDSTSKIVFNSDSKKLMLLEKDLIDPPQLMISICDLNDKKIDEKRIITDSEKLSVDIDYIINKKLYLWETAQKIIKERREYKKDVELPMTIGIEAILDSDKNSTKQQRNHIWTPIVYVLRKICNRKMRTIQSEQYIVPAINNSYQSKNNLIVFKSDINDETIRFNSKDISQYIEEA